MALSTPGDYKHLVAVLRDSEQFYADAARKVHEDAHRELFRAMAMSKREVADELESLLSPAERAEMADGTLIGKIRECYAKCRALLIGDADAVFVKELEAAEDRVLDAFRRNLSTTRQRKVRAALERIYPRAIASHERMSAMKKSMDERQLSGT